jgi:hypothetical protein
VLLDQLADRAGDLPRLVDVVVGDSYEVCHSAS